MNICYLDGMSRCYPDLCWEKCNEAENQWRAEWLSHYKQDKKNKAILKKVRSEQAGKHPSMTHIIL